jgi:hypothetical protein
MEQPTTNNQPAVRSGFERPKSNSSDSVMKWIVVVILIAVVILGGLFLVSKYSRFNVLGLNSTTTTWQAVFLTNGQVYFGKISSESGSEVVLKDIYYLQVTQPLQTSGEEQQPAQQNELSLVKLGNELHGPQDEMRINRDHILFVEDLKTDSRVVEAINNYKTTQQQ